MNSRFPALCFLIAAALALSACSSPDTATAQTVSATPAPLVVTVVKAVRTHLSSDLALTAEFEPYQQIDVMSKVAGFVRSISVDIGDRVHEGQVLATLEIPEMDDEVARSAAAIDQADDETVTASDELQRAKAAHDLAHLSYTRISTVIKTEPGIVPQQEVDEARSRDLVAEAQVSAAESAFRSAQQKVKVVRADQARLQTLRKYATIAAPFDGVVTKRYANYGAMVQAGVSSQTQAMPVVQLSQNNLLRLILPAPESVAALVHIGESVDVKVSSLGKTFPGRVKRFAGKIQESTRTMDTEVDVPNPSLALIPGMYAEVSLRVNDRPNALAVPLDAIDRSGPSPRVFTVTSAGIVQAAAVTTGVETDRLVEILSGLHDGDLVVVGRRAGLKDQQQVQTRVLEAQAN